VAFSSFTDNDTVTLNGQALTGVATPSGATQFELGAGLDDTITATNFADFVNAQATSTAADYFTAKADAKTVTLFSAIPGLAGNKMTLAISADGSVSAAALADGTEAADVTIRV
jgi:hypothetical protein